MTEFDTLLLMEEIRRENQPGMVKKTRLTHWDKLPTSTIDHRISEL